MLRAYRRGLLEPYYAQGRQSMARESMVLQMMAAELDAENIESQVLHQTVALAPHLDPKKVNSYVESMLDNLRLAADRREYKPYDGRSKADTLLSNSEGMIKAFKMLQQRGIIAQFQKRVQTIHETLAQ